jgi:hypothetical protein
LGFREFGEALRKADEASGSDPECRLREQGLAYVRFAPPPAPRRRNPCQKAVTASCWRTGRSFTASRISPWGGGSAMRRATQSRSTYSRKHSCRQCCSICGAKKNPADAGFFLVACSCVRELFLLLSVLLFLSVPGICSDFLPPNAARPVSSFFKIPSRCSRDQVVATHMPAGAEPTPI